MLLVVVAVRFIVFFLVSLSFVYLLLFSNSRFFHLPYVYCFQNEAVRKAFDYFDACADSEAIDSSGLTPILGVIRDYGSWNITGHNWTENSWNFMATLVKMHKELMLSPLFRFKVEPDQENSSLYTISVRK